MNTKEIQAIKKYLIESGIDARVTEKKYNFYPRLAFYEETDWLWGHYQWILNNYDIDNLELLGSNEIEGEKDLKLELLSRCPTYYGVNSVNLKVAAKCKLVPFTYQENEYLAFGACGMDLSPRLDAYQALVNGTIDSGSNILKPLMDEYCIQLLGKPLYEEAKASATLAKICLIIT